LKWSDPFLFRRRFSRFLDEASASMKPEAELREKFQGYSGTDCTRCGECCLRSSPTLQAEDLHLIRSGSLQKQNLITLRKGELVTDIVKNSVVRASGDIVKIREKKGGGRGCLFYDKTTRACSIYDVRPLQCRALKCWDNTEILEVLDRPKLRRRDVVRNRALVGLIEAHEKRCDYDALEDQVRSICSEGAGAVRRLIELLKFDFHLRLFISQKLNIPADEMDFLFGRPLVETIKNYGLQVLREPDGSFFLTKVSEKGENGMLE
jgi:Fe-S-cluster containining protein